MQGIAGKTAIVTGAATGIGRASAKRFAAEGANVTVADINSEDGSELVQQINENGGNAIFVKTDVGDSGDVEAMVNETVETFGSVDFAHNNAGTGHSFAPVHEFSYEEWDQNMNVNLRGIFSCMKEQLKYMSETGEGAIVNTSSLAGLWASPLKSAYISSKHGVVGLTKTAALEYANDGIRINAICPGLTRTQMTEDNLEAGRKLTAMDRAAEPREQAGMAVWLCSDDASFITGTAIPIDGGSVNGPRP